jgi:tetratricopeptide (TPR) repeat protein
MNAYAVKDAKTPLSTTLPFDEVIQELASSCPPPEEPNPYVFIVGAGISYPSVPLASEITAHCQKRAEGFKIPPPPRDTSPMKLYSYWFEKAYPQPHQRQQYLQSLIENKSISLANFRLAHLLLSKRVATTVVTPNFDDFLWRALITLGDENVLLCDNPNTEHRIKVNSGSVQIVHVHGTYRHYDLANLEPEIEARASQSPATNQTMSHLLDAIFRDHSPIVVGYSGWENDVIMRAIRRRVETYLGYKLYWFCHKKDTVDTLPAWLKGHNLVVFGAPHDPASKETLASLSDSNPAVAGSDKCDGETTRAIPGSPNLISATADPKGALEAQMVFDRLVVALGLDSPPLVKDPLQFFADRLEKSLPKDGSLTGGAIAYSFASIIEDVKNARQLLKRESENATSTDKVLLERMRDAVSRSQYQEALTIASEIAVEKLSKEDLRGLVDTLSVSGQNADPKTADILPGLNTLAMASQLVADVDNGPKASLALADAWLLQQTELARRGLDEDAFTVSGNLLRRFGGTDMAELQAYVTKSLSRKAYALWKLNRNTEAIPIYDEILNRVAGSNLPALQEQAAKALVNKGIVLRILNRSEEAIALHDELVRRFADSTLPALQEQVGKALVNKGFMLGALNRREEAIAAYDDLLRRFADSTFPALQEQVAQALVNKGFTLGALNRSEEAIAAYDDLLRRFADSTLPALQKLVANARTMRETEARKLGHD